MRYINSVKEDLGFYPVQFELPLLMQIKLYNYAMLFLSLLFRIVITMFICISVLLIYSLLSVSVE